MREGQKVYILIGCHDEGIHTCLTTKAKDVKEAIERFTYFPFTREDFVEEGLTFEEGKQIVYGFYGLLGRKAYSESNNYVDGDSNSQYIIIEVGNNVKLYPEVTKVSQM